ncbi:MAG: MBL fold metallo-hydrolase, partial [Acidilobaceae archaeon]
MGALVEVVRGGSLATNCYILVSGGEAVVVDPGWPGVVRVVLDRLRVAGAELRAIVLTHMHFDHTLGVSELAGATGADVVVGRVEYYAALRLAEVRLEGVEEPLFPPLGVDPSTLVSEGDSIRVGDVELRVLEAPGHSPGSIVLVGSRLAFTGDVLFKGSVGRVDLPGSDPHA